MTAIATFDDFPSPALLPGEVLVRQGGPSGVLRLRALLISTVIGVFGVVTIPLLPVLWWAALREVEVHRYWLTNRRLIVRTGIIGYRIRSIPVSRVADVSVRASWFDRLLGLTHIDVRDMTGESAGDGISRGAKLLAVESPDAWSEDILARSGGSLATEGQGELAKMVGLLEALVAKAA